jgi:hypothetical protein
LEIGPSSKTGTSTVSVKGSKIGYQSASSKSSFEVISAATPIPIPPICPPGQTYNATLKKCQDMIIPQPGPNGTIFLIPPGPGINQTDDEEPEARPPDCSDLEYAADNPEECATPLPPNCDDPTAPECEDPEPIPDPGDDGDEGGDDGDDGGDYGDSSSGEDGDGEEE